MAAAAWALLVALGLLLDYGETEEHHTKMELSNCLQLSIPTENNNTVGSGGINSTFGAECYAGSWTASFYVWEGRWPRPNTLWGAETTDQVQVHGAEGQRDGALAINAEAISAVELSDAGGEAISACEWIHGCGVEVPVMVQPMLESWQTLKECCGARNSTAGFAAEWNNTTCFGSWCRGLSGLAVQYDPVYEMNLNDTMENKYELNDVMVLGF